MNIMHNMWNVIIGLSEFVSLTWLGTYVTTTVIAILDFESTKNTKHFRFSNLYCQIVFETSTQAKTEANLSKVWQYNHTFIVI